MPQDCLEPEIIFCGLNAQLDLLIKLYKLTSDKPLSVITYGQEYEAKEVHGFTVQDISELKLDKVKAVISFMKPNKPISFLNEVAYDAQSEFFGKHGISADKLIFSNEPGKIFRALESYLDRSKLNLSYIAYTSIYNNVYMRHYYAFGILLAAEEARRMRRKSVTIIESGVWHGQGLLNMCEIADYLTLTQGMQFKIIGLDTGKGLTEVKDWRDHPELWATGEMALPDTEKLKRMLPSNAELIIGDVKDTVPLLISDGKFSKDSPLGFLVVDVDLYSSTVDLLKILDADAESLLPALVMWVDDSFVNIMQNNFAGEALAISEFNAAHPLRKIDHKYVRSNRPPQFWHQCFYFCHVFDHPVRQGKEKANFFNFFDYHY